MVRIAWHGAARLPSGLCAICAAFAIAVVAVCALPAPVGPAGAAYDRAKSIVAYVEAKERRPARIDSEWRVAQDAPLPVPAPAGQPTDAPEQESLPPHDAAVSPFHAGFPVLFTNKKLLRATGIMIEGYGEQDGSITHFPNKCYKDTGDPGNPSDGLYDLSVSDSYLRQAEGLGFTLRSLCLGLQSGIRFDPETGSRLPTYILAAPSAVGAEFPNSNVEATGELGLVVPKCFRNGLPYSDCKMRHDPITGAPLGETLQARYRDLGALIEADLAEGISSGRLTPPSGGDNGWMMMGDSLPFYLSNSDDGGPKWEHQSRMDISGDFPKGFGYGLYAPWPGGGPPPKTPEDEKAVQEGTNIATEATTQSLAEKIIAFFTGG